LKVFNSINRHLFFIITITALLSFTVMTSSAQTSSTPNTPDSTPLVETIPTQSNNTPATQRAALEPFTQSDLQIITGNVQRPNGILWFNNNLYTACTGDSTLYEINSETGRTLTYIGGVRNAHTLHADPTDDGSIDLWVPDYDANQLLHITGRQITRVNSDLAGPWGITRLDEQRFLITNLLDNTLVSVTETGRTEAVLTDLASPTGLVLHDDTLYVANNGSTRRAIEYYPSDIADGEQASENNVLVSGLQNTTGLAMGQDGNLYFAYALGTRGVVGRVNPIECRENGGCTAEDIDIVVYTELQAPLAGLTLSDDMRLFVHTMFRPEIYWVQIES